MPSRRTVDDEETFYVCGQCGLEQYYLKTKKPPIPCVDCGYVHKDYKKFDIPNEIKLDLNKYG